MSEKRGGINIVAIRGSAHEGNYTAMALDIVVDELEKDEHVATWVVDPAEMGLPLPGTGGKVVADDGALGDFPKHIRHVDVAFPPEIARRLVERLEFHFTPKHGSWLNIAEIELSILTQQCLDRRIPCLEELRKETEAWGRRRNAEEKTVDWQFATANARIKLKRLYP